jgi:hypothetical protein
MAFHGYQAFTNNLGISSVMVIFSLSGSLMLWTLSPTKVIEVQAKPQSTKNSGLTVKPCTTPQVIDFYMLVKGKKEIMKRKSFS